MSVFSFLGTARSESVVGTQSGGTERDPGVALVRWEPSIRSLRGTAAAWSDETSQRPSYRMFCIGQPDPQQPGMIRLDSGMCLPVGTHLWEHGPVMRLNDGTQVAKIPLTSRFAVQCWSTWTPRCDTTPIRRCARAGLIRIPRGLGRRRASVVAHDDMGWCCGGDGMQPHRQVTCNPKRSPLEIPSLLGKVGSRGPLRAKPNLGRGPIWPQRDKLRGGGGMAMLRSIKTPPRGSAIASAASIGRMRSEVGMFWRSTLGKSEEQLKQRLADESQLKTASSFHDEGTVERTIATAP